jgi:hypothetical protein
MNGKTYPGNASSGKSSSSKPGYIELRVVEMSRQSTDSSDY